MAIAVHQGRLGEVDLVAMAPPVLFRVAATGDAVAVRLVARQAEEVCVMAVTAMRQLRLDAAGTVIVLGGGLLQAGDPLLTGEIEARFTLEAPGAILRVADVPPVAGAALLGLDHLGASPGAAPRLRQSLGTALPEEFFNLVTRAARRAPCTYGGWLRAARRAPASEQPRDLASCGGSRRTRDPPRAWTAPPGSKAMTGRRDFVLHATGAGR